MDETYGTYIDDACFDMHGYDDNTGHYTNDDTHNDTDEDINDDADDDADDVGRWDLFFIRVSGCSRIFVH